MKNTVIVDIDGTIAKVGERLKYLKQTPPNYDKFYESCFNDKPIEEMVQLVSLFMKTDIWNDSAYDVIFCTGRRESVREKTEAWLQTRFYEFETGVTPLLMRPNNDHRHDTEVKPEQIAAIGISPDDVAFILEDRNSMVKKWRELGYKCLQVAEGDF